MYRPFLVTGLASYRRLNALNAGQPVIAKSRMIEMNSPASTTMYQTAKTASRICDLIPRLAPGYTQNSFTQYEGSFPGTAADA